MSINLVDMVADHLLPGFGFFGATDPFALRIDVDREIEGFALTIRGAKPEFLNIGSIEFVSDDGQFIERSELIKSAHLSTVYSGQMGDECAERIIAGKLIHSEKEAEPRLEVRFRGPTKVSFIIVRNRGDGYGRRSRFLNVEVLSGEAWELIYENDTAERRRRALAELCEISKVELTVESTADVLPQVERIREGLRRKFEAGPPDLEPLDLCRLLPLHIESAGTTDFYLLVVATIILKHIGGRHYTPTAALRPLKPVLSSSIAIERARQATSRLDGLWTGATAPVVFAKHRIMKSCPMLDRRDEYLSALDQAFEVLEGMGVTVMLCYGSLLGAVRDGAFIPHDDDVDVLCYYGAENREEAVLGRTRIIEQLKGLGYPVWAVGEDNFHVTFNKCSLDFFICWSDGEELELLMEKYRSRAIRRSIVLPPSKVRLYDRTYSAPANPPLFLEERYGDGWRAPDPYHEWPWKIERFEGLPRASVIRGQGLRAEQPRRSIDRTAMIAWGQRIGGARTSPPKNSLPIISCAIEAGFDAVELDVRISRDDVPVLAHDDKLIGPDGSIMVTQSSAEELSRFNLGLWEERPCFVSTLSHALTLADGKDVMIDPRMKPEQLRLVRQAVDTAHFDRSRLLFCVYDVASAHELVALFPESVLLWKIGLQFHEIGSVDLDKASALGMDGVMLVWPLYDQDFSAITDELRARGLRVLYYIHGGGFPVRPYPDDPTRSLQNMIDAGVDYVTSTAHHLPLFRELVGLD